MIRTPQLIYTTIYLPILHPIVAAVSKASRIIQQPAIYKLWPLYITENHPNLSEMEIQPTALGQHLIWALLYKTDLY